MDNFILLIPLGGLGERFKKNGYILPKPLVNVMGKPIIYWLLDNLNLSKVKKIIIPYHRDLSKFCFEEELKQKYKNSKFTFYFKEMKENTEGAADTIFKVLEDFEKDTNSDDSKIISLDGDNFYTEDILNKFTGNNVFYFNDETKEPIYSYINDDINGNINEIIEKEKISNKACTGAYGFSSWKNLKKYCKNVIDKGLKQKNEYYISSVIRNMIENGEEFKSKEIKIENYHCLGTPLHVRLFCNNYPRIHALNNERKLEVKRYCFDLDNTLVTYPEKSGDYSTVKPIEKNIRMVRYLKKLGHTIIIHTARRMKTHGGNQGALLKDIGKITFDSLDKFNIPYDEIYFGKPYADYYIDDKAVSAYDDLEKILGFYDSSIETRDFNSLSNTNTIHTLRKEGKDLSGEIYYYNNIPKELKDLYPIYLRGDDNKNSGEWYEMERINGIPFSKLYLSEEMTEKQLEHIIGSLSRLHNFDINTDKNNLDINIYENYVEKIKKRYESYDYSKFNGSKNKYKILIEKLSVYEEKKKGKIGIIHGDPVLTNIMINQYGKIKFIDMRGKIGDKLTIYGDIYYDYAKLYQSLIGYDEILMDKKINIEYKKKMIRKMEDIIIEKFGEETLEEIKIICSSLLFTLIPLHNNDKCYKYFDLIIM